MPTVARHSLAMIVTPSSGFLFVQLSLLILYCRRATFARKGPSPDRVDNRVKRTRLIAPLARCFEIRGARTAVRASLSMQERTARSVMIATEESEEHYTQSHTFFLCLATHEIDASALHNPLTGSEVTRTSKRFERYFAHLSIS